MIDRMYCQEQLARFSGLPGYPRTDDGKRSMIDAMQGAFGFAGRDALQRWVDDELRQAARCPLPRDAYQHGAAVSPAKVAPATHCYACYDTGQVAAEWLVTWHGEQRTRQLLTAEQVAALWTRHREAESRGDRGAMFAVGRQMIYQAPTRCACQPDAPHMPEPPAERERYR